MGIAIKAKVMLKVTGLKKFKADLARFAKKIDADVNTIVKLLAFEAFQSVVSKTPVDTGFARSGWNIVKEGQGYIITNNVPYIIALENGHSKQSGKGYMVTRTLNELEANFGKIVKEVNRT